MADSSIEAIVNDLLPVFGVDALKDEQKSILHCLIDKTDCMAVLPTGFGKSLPYQMYSLVNRRLTGVKEIVVVCCPLVALMQDQVEKMSNIPEVKSAYAGSSTQSDMNIKDGLVDIIYASPETLVGDPEWRASIQELPVSVLVIDEFHTIATWGDNVECPGKETFRKWFNDIGELRSLFPKSTVLALSATCTLKIRKRVKKVLHLAADVNEIVISPNKANIRVLVAKIPNTVEMSMHWLIEGLSQLREKFPRTIIYCTSIKDVSDIYSYVTQELPFASNLLEMFHSETPRSRKQKILENLTNLSGEIKIVIATSALGMGLDVKNCHSVILFGPPVQVVDLLQAIGRVGRDGEPSIAIILYNSYHLRKLSSDVKEILRTTDCRRISLLQCFLKSEVISLIMEKESRKHTCCDLCRRKCECQNCSMLPLEEIFHSSGSSCAGQNDSDISDSGTEEYFSNNEHELENLELS